MVQFGYGAVCGNNTSQRGSMVQLGVYTTLSNPPALRRGPATDLITSYGCVRAAIHTPCILAHTVHTRVHGVRHVRVWLHFTLANHVVLLLVHVLAVEPVGVVPFSVVVSHSA